MSEGYRIVRPGQLILGDFRIGIAALRTDGAVLQVHARDDLPIRRLALHPGESGEADGWTIELESHSLEGRGSVEVRLTPSTA